MVDGPVPPELKKHVNSVVPREPVEPSKPDNAMVLSDTDLAFVAENEEEFDFTWSTQEYCDNGHLRVVAMFSAPGLRLDGIRIDSTTSYMVNVHGTWLMMTYNFENFCKW